MPFLRCAAAVVVVAMAASGLSARQAKPADIKKRKAELQHVLDRYRAGGHEVVAREIPGPLDPLTRSALFEMLSPLGAHWEPASAAFLLEVAVAVSRAGGTSSPLDVSRLVTVGRRVVLRRPAAIGRSPAEDRFEMVWHHVALGLLEGAGVWYGHNEHLVATEPRLLTLEKLEVPFQVRWPLMRAMNAAVQCCPNAFVGGPGITLIVMSGGQAPQTPWAATDAVALFEKAAVSPALRGEALVREAHLYLGLGKVDAGLAALDRTGPIDDPLIRYASVLIRAGLLDRQGNAAAAADAYEAATRLGPGAQVPAIGLAAALLRAGRVDDAVVAADTARRMPTDGEDPWPVFRRADGRFVDGWLTALRAALDELPK